VLKNINDKLFDKFVLKSEII